MHQLRLFFTALEYFTRLPKPAWVGFDPSWLGPSMRYFPAVGLVVGALGAGIYGSASLLWPGSIAVLLSMAATLLVTGAFHEDGLADFCDALGAGGSRERMLAIMKDSHIGAFGALGLLIVLWLKFEALVAMPASWTLLALILGHGLSRWAASTLIVFLPYVRPADSSKAKPLAETREARNLVVGACFAFGPIALLTPTLAGSGFGSWFLGPLLIASGAAVAASVVIGAWCARHLGGITGDCLGAAQQVSELTFYLALVAGAGHWL